MSPQPPGERARLAGAGVLPLAEALARLGQGKGVAWTELLAHGTLSVEIYAPRGVDTQEPHTRDEVYVVANGAGAFLSGTRRDAFRAGDLIFVPAGVTHRFENFSDDLVVWVIFYGPEGGEQP